LVTADEVAAAFGLGEPIDEMIEAARGWGGHNIVYRLDTTAGRWAIKALRRELDGLLPERFEIELAAFAGGVGMARPVAAVGGGPVAVVAGQQVRCHEWIDGEAKVNEQTTATESRLMGELVGHLHGLSLSWSNHFDDVIPDEDELSWAALATKADRRHSALAPLITEHLVALEALGKQGWLLRQAHRELPRIGSHRDLNAHNVLFSDTGLRLIDWEAAGPIFAPWERACYATLWSARDSGRYDLEAVTAFLRGYRHAGGEIDHDDPDTLDYLVENVASWTKKNVRWALETITPEQDHWARELIEALLATPATIEQRRHLLQEGISRLDRGA
jgi:Ser/Thr protein kinase RdoA (MazF antagonist)